MRVAKETTCYFPRTKEGIVREALASELRGTGNKGDIMPIDSHPPIETLTAGTNYSGKLLSARIEVRSTLAKVGSLQYSIKSISNLKGQVQEIQDLPYLVPESDWPLFTSMSKDEWESLPFDKKNLLIGTKNVHIFGGEPSDIGDVHGWDLEELGAYIDPYQPRVVQGLNQFNFFFHTLRP